LKKPEFPAAFWAIVLGSVGGEPVTPNNIASEELPLASTAASTSAAHPRANRSS